MEELASFESSNINTLWLQNVYENLKNLEMNERLAREGCSSLMEYFQIPAGQRHIIIADIQYKNLRFIVTEISLLLTDLTPVVEVTLLEEFRTKLEKIDKVINQRSLFVKESYSASKNIVISSNMTQFFHQTLDFLSRFRVEIIKSIAHLLYLTDSKEKKKWKQ